MADILLESKKMEIRTFTHFWSSDMKMYSFNDITLPFPVSLKVLGSFVVTAIPWWGLLFLFNVPLVAPWHVLWASVPLLAAFLSSANFFEKKTILQYLKSRIGYLMEERRYKGLEKDLNKYNKPAKNKINIIIPLDNKRGE